MTLGLHDVAPRRQQRFVEVLNTGSTAPPFAVLEVYGSQNPDGDSSRTVLVVRQPTDPTRYPVVFNGPHPLAGGGYRTTKSNCRSPIATTRAISRPSIARSR